MRAPASGNRLDEQDAAVAKGMLDRGDRQHDIAAWFGVNGGRIAELSTGEAFPDVPPITKNLPPPGPYNSGKTVHNAISELSNIRIKLADLLVEIDKQIYALK